MGKVILAAILLAALAVPVRADYDAGYAAYKRGDYAAALSEFKPLAEQGDANAQYNLGIMYDKGQGVEKDYAQAMEWYARAARQGQPNAQNNLGLMYAQGHGVDKDYVTAHMWLNLSAVHGGEKTMRNRDFVTQQMTPDQIAKAQRLAREWKPEAE